MDRYTSRQRVREQWPATRPASFFGARELFSSLAWAPIGRPTSQRNVELELIQRLQPFIVAFRTSRGLTSIAIQYEKLAPLRLAARTRTPLCTGKQPRELVTFMEAEKSWTPIIEVDSTVETLTAPPMAVTKIPGVTQHQSCFISRRSTSQQIRP